MQSPRLSLSNVGAAPGIRYTSSAPEPASEDIALDLSSGWIEGTAVRAEAMAAQPIKAMIDPKDIAALAVFLASDAAKSISGQVLPIDNDRQRA
jgi:NAD(P)-dependent dehydrogenase (short-subunit alcohol dehydrogenase family)